MFQDDWIFSRLVVFIPLLLSLSVHEWAHAFAAWRLGDDTARLQGRLSLNPIVHIDPLGTLVLPLMGFPFGWAKPVPFEPVRFRRSVNMRFGTLLVAVAGPVSNLCIAVLSVGGLAALSRWGQSFASRDLALQSLLQTLVVLNVILALFNLLPIPPLDGSHIVGSLMPDRLQPVWSTFSKAGPLMLLAVILLPQIAGFSLLAVPLGWVHDLLAWITPLSHGSMRF
jgi:Zn-dependent protease